MPVKYFAVIDTNVLVSAVLKQKSVPGSIIELAFDGPITPVLNEDIEAEYRKVLLRPKFHLTEDIVNDIIDTFHQRGLYIDSEAIDIDLPDPKDRVFYEVVMEERKDEDAYLVTGNIRHFPTAPFIVTPRQMLDIILKDQEG
ncbi:PIN family putative toxin-antitoxin system toxin component [Stomatobaculum longum]|jgi:probable toxin-antitoxin system toxin component, PIN family|uniref:PIN family putative toxin-antitoxin system toxin component n=1 Tax=Stomatobaculum longum TaxID=796942 RepID=A0AA36Y4P7_9FIRM|nr:PIN family putative toxin-antitoxin system toxin component [Stomatobaculum longum]